MGKLIDLSCKTFGNWVVICRSQDNIGGKPAWVCKCKCGTIAIVRGSDLRLGSSKQCVKCRPRIHGHTSSKGYKSPEYNSWLSMKNRCTNLNATGYNRYGGRGVKVCKRWINSFENFLHDMGPRPQGTSLDRINNNGNYTPSNCQWASANRQSYNKCSNRYIRYKGMKKCISEWCSILGIDEELVRGRLKLGWTFSDAVTTPTLIQRGHRKRDRHGRFAKSH